MISSALKKYVWLALAIMSIPIAHYYMYEVMSQPGDATTHGFGLWIVSFLWCLFVGVIFIIGALWNKGSRARKNYAFALMYLPLAFYLIWTSFYQFFKSYIDAIYPGRSNGSGLAEDGVAYLFVATTMAIVASLLIYFNPRPKP